MNLNTAGQEDTVDPDQGGEVDRGPGDVLDHGGGHVQETEDTEVGHEVIPEDESHAVDLDEGRGHDHVVLARRNPGTLSERTK